MECPRCSLLNPDSAKRCDCGYNFQTGRAESRGTITPVAGTVKSGMGLDGSEGRPGVGRRISAFLLDGFLLGMLMAYAASIGMAALVAVGGLYTLVEAFTGWTLGKLVLALRIRNADARPARRLVLFQRWALKNSAYILGTVSMVTGVWVLSLIAMATAVVLMIGGLWVLGQSRQALHDKLLSTAVFRANALRTPA